MNVFLNICVPAARAPVLSLLAITAVAWSAEPAQAADLGGDCCADLEERIAELEATTARKGNRKVSLTISGYIAQELTWWDDGEESNAYLHGLGPTQATNVRFGGQAQISPGWTAGFLMRIQNLSDDPFGRLPNGDAMNQNDPNLNRGLNTQMAYWYIQNKDLGKISVGRMAHAGKSTAMGTDQSGTQIIDSYTLLAGFPQFIIRTDGDLSPPQLTWGQLLRYSDGRRFHRFGQLGRGRFLGGGTSLFPGDLWIQSGFWYGLFGVHDRERDRSFASR